MAAAAGLPLTALEPAQSGDRRAFGQLLRHHDDRMRGLAWRMLGDRDRMDDVLQEAYLKAWAALPGFRLDADFGTWLYRITYNTCVDELRRAGRRPVPCDWSAPGEHPVAQAAGPERHAVAADVTARALASLSEEQRAAVVLVYGEGFDNQTAADLLGVAVGTIASRLSRARASLRARLGEEDRRELVALGCGEGPQVAGGMAASGRARPQRAGNRPPSPRFRRPPRAAESGPTPRGVPPVEVCANGM